MKKKIEEESVRRIRGEVTKKKIEEESVKRIRGEVTKKKGMRSHEEED